MRAIESFISMRNIVGAGLGLALLGALPVAAQTIGAAIADPSRPTDEVARDAVRRPAEVLSFVGIKPGLTIAERYPGNNYYSRILAKALGPKGRLHVLLFLKPDGAALDEDKATLLTGLYPNVSLEPRAEAAPTALEPLDLVLSIDNFHDAHNGPDGVAGAAVLNTAVFKALKPGGAYVVIDHAAPAGAGATLTAKLHRIEMQTARAEIEAAGFVFTGSSDVLRNPSDPRTAIVSDPSVAGHTDQFIMKFRKPG